MECIEQLQSSHLRLCSLYNNLYSNQRHIVSHEFGCGQDLSISSLLKFAPIAENFQSYADDYKKELSKFQTLLNTVQQTVKKTNISSNKNKNVAIINGNMMMKAEIDDHKGLSNDLSFYDRKNAQNDVNDITTPSLPYDDGNSTVKVVLNDDELFSQNMDTIDGIHEEDEFYQIQRNEMQQKECIDILIPSISYCSILNNNNNNTYCYNNTFDINSVIYTSTMLRFSGCYGLREDNEEDKALVKEIMINEIKFKQEYIENVQIRNGRVWCIVYVRCSMKYICDRIKKLEKNQKTIYRLNQYQRRRNIQENVKESNKLYILNFDVLNKNCHKALTNLFLKFGDLADDIKIGINSRNDPFAKVTYKDINNAKKLWNYQNFNSNTNHKKIMFGKRELTIQYAKY